MTEKRLTIDGMSCQHCVAAVNDALQAVDGVRVEHVGIGSARIRYDPGEVDAGRIRAAVEAKGFQVRGAGDGLENR